MEEPMGMVEIVDFSTWLPYEGFSAGSGRSEKQGFSHKMER